MIVKEMEESFNEDFCKYLEYHLCDTFQKSGDKEIRKLWCDGVVWSHTTKKHVNDKRLIETTAFIGQNGQEEYRMRLKFGKFSLRRYAKGTSLKGCIPNSESMNWIVIDIENKYMEIQLR